MTTVLLRIAPKEEDSAAMPALVALLLDTGHRTLPGMFSIDLPELGQQPHRLGRFAVAALSEEVVPQLREILSLSNLRLEIRTVAVPPESPMARLRRCRPDTLGPAAKRRLQRRRLSRGEAPIAYPEIPLEPVHPAVLLRSRSTGQVFPFLLAREVRPFSSPPDPVPLDFQPYPIMRWIPSVTS